VHNESFIFSVQDSTLSTKEKNKNQEIFDTNTVCGQKNEEKKTPKRVSFIYFYLFNVTLFNLIFPWTLIYFFIIEEKKVFRFFSDRSSIFNTISS